LLAAPAEAFADLARFGEEKLGLLRRSRVCRRARYRDGAL
jgi:hypothetical protein